MKKKKEKTPTEISLISFELAQIHQQEREKRNFFVTLVLTLALFISNMIWLYVFQCYDYISYEVIEQDGDGHNFYNNNIQGDVLNGTENK